MEFSGYARLWADRQVRTIFVAAFFARIPALAMPLVLTLLVVEKLDGSYAQAGVVAACETVGAAIGAPWRGRLIDRLGLRRALVPSIVAMAVVVPAAALVPSYLALLPLAFLTGVFLIPIYAIVRLALNVRVTEDQRRTAFAADSTIAEASFIVGPAVGGWLATRFDAGVALLAVGLCVILAGVLFYVLNPPLRAQDEVATEPAGPQVATDPAGALRVGGIRTWITAELGFLYVVSAGMMIALIATDLSVIAELRELDHVGLVGVVYFFWGASSLLGGLIYGALPTSLRPSYLLLALGLLTVPVGLGGQVWSLGLWVVPAGFLCAPAMTAAAEWIARLVPHERLGEAMGWQGTAFTLGGALGSPLVGASIDGAGAWAGFAVGGGVAALLAVLSLAGQRLLRARTPAAPAPF